ncbi:MAG: 3-hydroxyacyl-ACP dehydratase FabZ family protein [Ginsengibacter sp.]
MYTEIFEHLPYKSSFRFVDNITSLNTGGVTGDYTLRKDAFFYEDHFIDNPVTPGVIITEIMAQIGLVVLGIYLILDARKSFSSSEENKIFPLLTSTEVSFFKPVLPGEKVTVKSEKEYFRFGKLKCYVEMLDSKKDLVARGTFSGIIKNAGKENKLL